MNTKKQYTIVLYALFTAMIAVLSQISIPLPGGVPITLQTFAVALCGYVLGCKGAVISVSVYLALGAVGVPVFSGLSGGITRLVASPTAGFLWGFLLLALFCGMRKTFNFKYIPATGTAMGIVGLVLCHLCGSIVYACYFDVSIFKALAVATLPFIVKDILSVVFALSVSRCLKRVSTLA